MPRFPVALNPFKTRNPTTRLGRIGKDINPLNPRNAAALVLEEAIRAVADRTLPQAQADDVSARVGYFGFGPKVGAVLNILDAGPTNAYDTLEGQAELQRRQDAYNLKKSQEAARERSVYIADDYGPPRPVRYPSGQVLLGDYVVKRFDPPEEKSSLPPAPPQDRPVEERRPPVSETVPPTSTPSPEERTQENDLARFYAKTHMRGSEMAQGGELQRRLWESGEMRGMTPESFMSWVEANPGLAYREASRRGLLPEYETNSFK